MDNLEQIENLPLSGKLQTASIFELLQLSTSSDLAKVRKEYYKKVDALEKEANKNTEKNLKAELVQELRLLEKTFQEFSLNIQNNTQDLFQVKQALKDMDLNQNDDWETIQDRYKKEAAQGSTPDKTALESNYSVLKQKEDWFKKKTGLPAKTVFASLGILAAAGISIAALSQFSGSSLLDSVKNFAGNTPADATPSSAPTTVESADALTNVAQGEQLAGLDQYIEDNMAFEDELLSNMGIIPDIRETLSVEYKMQIFQSMIKNI